MALPAPLALPLRLERGRRLESSASPVSVKSQQRPLLSVFFDAAKADAKRSWTGHSRGVSAWVTYITYATLADRSSDQDVFIRFRLSYFDSAQRRKCKRLRGRTGSVERFGHDSIKLTW